MADPMPTREAQQDTARLSHIRLTRTPTANGRQQFFYLTTEAVRILGAPDFINPQVEGDFLVLRGATEGSRLSRTNPSTISSCVFSARKFAKAAGMDALYPDRRIVWFLQPAKEPHTLIAPIASYQALRPRKTPVRAHAHAPRTLLAAVPTEPQDVRESDSQAVAPSSVLPTLTAHQDTYLTVLQAMEYAKRELLSVDPSTVSMEDRQAMEDVFGRLASTWSEYQKVTGVLEGWTQLRTREAVLA